MFELAVVLGLFLIGLDYVLSRHLDKPKVNVNISSSDMTRPEIREALTHEYFQIHKAGADA